MIAYAGSRGERRWSIRALRDGAERERLFVDLEQAAHHGHTKRHSCPDYPHVPREEASLVPSKTSKLLHRLECPKAPAEGVYFTDVEQAAEYGVERRHGVWSSVDRVVSPSQL